MQFRDLGKQYEVLRPQIDYAIASTIEKSTFIGGESVRNLEKELAEYVGVKYCISCANGTDALTAALMAWDIGVGDAVFVPDFTFFSTGEIVAFEGATPVFVDVDENTFNISVDSLEYQIKKVIEEGKLRPKAVIPVDLFGLPADYEKIYKVAKQYNLLILEDGAQGFGGELYGKKHVVLEISVLRLSFRQNHWDVMVMGVRFLLMMKSFRRCFVPFVFMGKEQ